MILNCLIFVLPFLAADGRSDKPFIIGRLIGQLGNNLFQIAAASALAWDNDAEAYFPDLNPSQNPWANTINHTHLFSRCRPDHPLKDPQFRYGEPSFAYHPISYQPNMQLQGYFQAEKYFIHHRLRILELFSPLPEDVSYIEKTYGHLLNRPLTVGIQVRMYHEDPSGTHYIQYGKDYITKAMALFPQDALFIVSSNDILFAKKVVPTQENVVFLQNEAVYIELYILSMCTHNIISNSTFGWWAAWLNQNPDKMVICPRMWLSPNWSLPTDDIVPEKWIKIDAKWGMSSNPASCE